RARRRARGRAPPPPRRAADRSASRRCRRAPRAPPPGPGPCPPLRARPGGAASPLELLVVGDAPAPAGQAHRDQPAALATVRVLDRDAAVAEVADGPGAVGVLLEEPVVHARLPRRLVDRLGLPGQ